MQGDLIGKGALRAGDHQGASEWQVKYNFAITTTVVRRPGLPVVRGHSSAIGTGSSIDGSDLLKAITSSPQRTEKLSA